MHSRGNFGSPERRRSRLANAVLDAGAVTLAELRDGDG